MERLKRRISPMDDRWTFRPTTPLGSWAVGCAIGSVALLFGAPLLNLIPGFAPVTYTLAFGAAILGGVLATIAIVRDRERAVSVWAAMIPLLFYAVFTALELLLLPEH